MPSQNPRSERGQLIPMFALALVTLVLATGVVIDGGYGYVQRRLTQNAADFAAMAATRIIGQKLTGRPPGPGCRIRLALATRLRHARPCPGGAPRRVGAGEATRPWTSCAA